MQSTQISLIEGITMLIRAANGTTNKKERRPIAPLRIHDHVFLGGQKSYKTVLLRTEV